MPLSCLSFKIKNQLAHSSTHGKSCFHWSLLDNLFYIKPLPLGLPLFIYPTLNLKNKEIRQSNRYLVLNPPGWVSYCCTFDYKIIHYLARNQNPEAAPWCPCLCGHVSPLPIMSQSSVVGFGNALLLREMRLWGLNISLCIFLQHQLERNNVGRDCINRLFFSNGPTHSGQCHCEDLKYEKIHLKVWLH